MAAKKGKLFVLALAGSPITPILTARNTEFTINGETVDVTNKGANGWRKLLAGAGIQSMSVSVDGVFEDETYEQTVHTAAMEGTIDSYVLTNEDGETWSGSFQVTSYGRSGTYNGEEAYSFTLESAGEITHTA